MKALQAIFTLFYLTLFVVCTLASAFAFYLIYPIAKPIVEGIICGYKSAVQIWEDLQ